MPLRERDLARPVAGHFAALGYRVFAEVGIAGRYADLVAYSSEELVAIELKLEDWKGALRQWMAYQLGTDRAFVAMPLARVQDVWRHRGAFEREGVGLLAIDAPRCVRRVLQAEFQARQFPPMRERLRGLLEETVNMLAVALGPPTLTVPPKDIEVDLVDHEVSEAHEDAHVLEPAAQLVGVLSR